MLLVNALALTLGHLDANLAIGVDANLKGTKNMKDQGIFESAASKKHQLELATQVVKMILKIDDVIAPQEYE